jgi:hypothetical protein
VAVPAKTNGHASDDAVALGSGAGGKIEFLSSARFIYGKWVECGPKGRPYDLFEWLPMDVRLYLCRTICLELLLCDPRASWFHYKYIMRDASYTEANERDPRWGSPCWLYATLGYCSAYIPRCLLKCIVQTDTPQKGV